jgi:TRAP-type C4-dicarboxylate transport system permease small subunit
MQLIWNRSQALARALALIGFTGLLVLALMTTSDVLMRWLFQAPLQGVNDVISVVMAVVISACIPANLAMKQNIRVEVFGAVAGPRLKAALEAFSSLLTFILIALIAWQFVSYVTSLKVNGDRTWVLGWQVWPWWSAATAMLWLAAFVQAMVLITDIASLFGGPDVDARANDDTSSPL